MSNHLPEEVWANIFTRLPVKTLLQIRSVCKLFGSIISNPAFISAHIKKTINQSHSRTLLLRYLIEKEKQQKEHYLLFTDSNDRKNAIFDETNCRKLEFPFKTRSKYHFRIVGSCNGLICLSDDNDFDTSGIILWNPSIKRFLNLPNPRVTSRNYGSYMYVLGFGYDETSDDYKVVRVAYMKGRRGRDLIPPEVELYSLNSRSWRSFNTGAPPYGIFGYTWLQAFVNGAVHWVGYDPCVVKGNDSCGLIVAFDLRDEVFREVMLPSCLEQCAWDVHITVFWGKLAVLHYDYGAHKNFCTVWVMEEYGLADSWTKLYTVDLRGGLRNLIGFLRNGVVIGTTVRGKLLSYDPITSRIENLRLRGAIGGFHVDSYMESLVLLEAESAASAQESVTPGDEQEEQAADLHAVKNRNGEFDHQEKLESFHSLRISEKNYSPYLCGGFSDQELSAKNCEEWVKELVPEANSDGWENDW